MTKKLLKNLFITFILSTLLSAAVNCIYFAIIKHGDDYQHVVPLIIVGVLFLNAILFLMSVPVLFLSFQNIYSNLPIRLLLYFTGPLLFIASIWFSNFDSADKLFYLITGFIYLTLHIISYFRSVKNSNN